MGQISENDFTPKAMLYRNTDNVFNSICENIVCSCNGSNPNNDCSLTLALKNSINPESNIVFINCIIPWESPLNYSLKAIKFTNWLRSMIIEQTQNNNNINDPNINASITNQSIQRLPSTQRNNAYGNNYDQKKNIIINNKIDYLEKENDNNYYNLNTFQNKIDKNNGLFNNIKNDYEEQIDNLTMINKNSNLINNKNNEMNYSAILPNSGKINTNYQNYLTQYPPKKENQENINN